MNMVYTGMAFYNSRACDLIRLDVEVRLIPKPVAVLCLHDTVPVRPQGVKRSARAQDEQI